MHPKNINNLNIKLIYIDKINGNPLPAFTIKLNECKVCKNKYFHNLEGKQAISLMKNFEFITMNVKASKFHEIFTVFHTINDYNE